VLCVVIPNCSPPNTIASRLGVALALYGIPGQAGFSSSSCRPWRMRYGGGYWTAPPAGSWTTS
jgi:hypothetical protein